MLIYVVLGQFMDAVHALPIEHLEVLRGSVVHARKCLVHRSWLLNLVTLRGTEILFLLFSCWLNFLLIFDLASTQFARPWLLLDQSQVALVSLLSLILDVSQGVRELRHNPLHGCGILALLDLGLWLWGLREHVVSVTKVFKSCHVCLSIVIHLIYKNIFNLI